VAALLVVLGAAIGDAARPASDPGNGGATLRLSARTVTFDVRDLPPLPDGASVPTHERDRVPERKSPKVPPEGTQTFAAIGAAVAVGASVPAPGSDASFEGLAYNDDCSGVQCGNGHPPDTVGDVGPSHYIQAINTAIGIFNKSTGARIAGFSFDDFMSQGSFGNLCDTDNYGDPVVLYDTFADRWVIADFAFQVDGSGNIVSPPGAYLCFAVSQSGDPVSGGWHFSSLHVTDGLPDYPKLGIWPDGIYVSANMFDFSAGGGFQNVRVWALNKAQLYAGQNPQVVAFDAPDRTGPCPVFTLLPSNARLQTGTPPAGRENLFASVWCYTARVRIWKFHVDWGNTANSTFTGPFDSVASTTWASPPGTVPSLNGNDLDVLGIRLMMQNQYSNIGGLESLWNAHTVAGSSSSQAAVRWYQVPVTGGAVGNPLQAATYNPDGSSRFMPSVAVDRIGNMAIGYSVSNGSMYPAIRYAGRLTGDAADTITQTERSLIEGGGTQVGNCGGSACERWGDYSAMTLDPDGCTFWYTNEYYIVSGLNHHTRIASFRYPSCVNSPPPTAPPPTPTPTPPPPTQPPPTQPPPTQPPPTPTPTAPPPTPTPTVAPTAPPTAAPTPASTQAVDTTPPSVSTPILSPTSALAGSSVTVTATATDGSAVASAQKRVDGGSWTAMSASDGAFDEASEGLTTTIAAPGSVGAHQVCVRATDASGNTSSGTACATLTVTNFSVSASPTSGSTAQGQKAAFAISVNRSGYSGSVSGGISGLPAGATAAFSPSATTGSSMTLTITTSNCGVVTPRGTYNLTVSGTAGGQTRTTKVALAVTNSAPTVSPPVSVLSTGRMGTSTVKVRTTWSACDPDGVARYKLQRQINGGTWTTISLSSSTAKAIKQRLPKNATVRYRVRAWDYAGNRSKYAYGTRFIPRIVNDRSSALAWVGTWSNGSPSGAYLGNVRYTYAAGYEVRYTFTGSSIGWVAYKGPTRGSANVYVDGVFVKTISLYRSTTRSRPTVFAFSWPTSSAHTIRIVTLGTAGHARIDVDAFVRLTPG